MGVVKAPPQSSASAEDSSPASGGAKEECFGLVTPEGESMGVANTASRGIPYGYSPICAPPDLADSVPIQRGAPDGHHIRYLEAGELARRQHS